MLLVTGSLLCGLAVIPVALEAIGTAAAPGAIAVWTEAEEAARISTGPLSAYGTLLETVAHPTFEFLGRKPPPLPGSQQQCPLGKRPHEPENYGALVERLAPPLLYA